MSDERADRRRRGLERMGEVYSFEVNDGPGDFFGYTVEHLFGDIWEREGLSLRDRRLLLIGLMVAEGLDGTLGIQLDSALAKGDLTAEDLREIVDLPEPLRRVAQGRGAQHAWSRARSLATSEPDDTTARPAADRVLISRATGSPAPPGRCRTQSGSRGTAVPWLPSPPSSTSRATPVW